MAFAIAAMAVFTVAGCKPKEKEQAPEQVIADKVVQKEETLIMGQVFITTKDGHNVGIGGQKVTLVEGEKIKDYFNSHADEWSNQLAEAQAKVDQAKLNYDALYKADLDKYEAAKKYHDNRIATLDTSSQEWHDAFDWSQKVGEKIRYLTQLKVSSNERKQLDEHIFNREFLWDWINYPAEDALLPAVDTTTTDSDGRFKFFFPTSSNDLRVLTKTKRSVGEEEENFWWLERVSIHEKTTEVILSNDNCNKSGVITFIKQPYDKYMEDYEIRVGQDKTEREYELLQEKLAIGDN
jgi:hypothetical protein